MAAVSWKKPVSGNWTLGADWSGGTVPAASDDVTIGILGGYTVAMTTAVAVHSLTLSDLAATLTIRDPGATEKVAANFVNAGTVTLDATGGGGTTLNIGGALANSGLFTIGNAGLAAATTVTAASLANTGEIDLIGGTAQATLDVTGATPATLTGQYVLQGNALLEVPSSSVSPSGGSITAIAGHAELVLDGAQARVAISSSTAGNSGLTGLASNAGTLAIQRGSKIATGGAFANNGLVEVDNDIFGTGDAGGSSLKVTGGLTNRGDLDIGNAGLTTATGVTAAALVNTAIGTVNLTGSDTVQASLTVGGAAPASLTGFYFLDGDALLQFGGGHVTSVAANSELSLDGARARVALAANPASNSALTLLAANNGILDLEDHAEVAIATGLVNRNTLDVDGGSDGGSTLGVQGVLTNLGSLQIGNEALHTATFVKAGGFANSGSLDLAGGAGRATLDSTAAAPNLLTGTIDLEGNALLEFASGSFAAIASGADLSLGGPRARVAVNTDPTQSGALAKLMSNAGTVTLADGAAVATLVSLNNTGTLDLDSFGGAGFGEDGGSSLTIGSLLTNSSAVNLGNAGILAPTLLSAGGLANTGTITLTGAAATAASFVVAAAAPTTLVGQYTLRNDALLQFKTGGVTAIGAGSGLFLDGALSRVALAAMPGSNSALTGLAGNAGTLSLADGAAVATKTVGLTNTGTIEIDVGGASGGGGLTLGGALTNKSSLDIGNSALAKAVTVTAPGLVNTGTVEVTGGAATPATLHVTGPAPATLTGTYSLAGDALLEYNSGGIGAIGPGADLTLSGTLSRVALTSAPATDSALLGLAGNAGILNLENGAALSITANFANNSAVEVDSFGSGGGSRLAVGGTLTNTSSLTIGNTAMTKAATVTAGTLANSGSLDMTSGAGAALLNVKHNFTNTGLIQIDTGGFSGAVAGGSSVVVLGTLNNTDSLDIGNTNLAKATTVTAAGLANSGTIDITGGTAAAILHIQGAAPATLNGTFDLAGNALLEYDSGGITAIGASSRLTLSGTQSLVALKTAPTTDSALTGLASNAGTLALENGAALTIAGGFNSSNLDVDDSSAGGSSLAIGGALTSNFLTIGSTGITKAVAVTAKSLVNSGTLNLASAAAAAANLTVANGFTNTGSVEIDASGFAAGGSGGSTLKIGGALTNNASGFAGVFTVGNNALSRAVTVTAGSVVNSATLDLVSGPAAAAKLTVTGGFTNTRSVEIDASGGGGSVLAIGGTLTNSASGFGEGLTIGNASLGKAALVTAKALANTGEIDITGAAAIAATLHIAGTAPASLAGTYALAGDALFEFDSGGVTALATGTILTLNGPKALVALKSAPTTNSALSGLATSSGTLALENGAALTTTGGFTNSSTVDIDSGFGATGGSSLAITGVLTNNASATIAIGNSGMTAATKVSAASLTNNADSNITIAGASGADTGTLSLTGASTDAGNLTVNSGGILTLGNTLTVSGNLMLDGGTVSGGTLAGSGTLETGFDQSATLSGVTIGSGSTFTAQFGSTLTLSGVTVSGSLAGSGSATLDFAKPTTAASLTNVSGFPTIGLASGAANTLSLADANFAGIFSGGITVNDGNSGNTVDAGSLSAANAITVKAGTGADVLTGGAGNDVFFAGGDTTMTGGGGANQFTFEAPGAANTIANFATSSTNELVFSNAGFNLGQSSAGSTLQALPVALFAANATGAFGNTAERFAYDTANGKLFASTDGSGSTPQLVATLTGHPSIGAASQLFFIS